MNEDEKKMMNLKLPEYRMLLYTDTVGGKQVSRDDMWVLSTSELNKIGAELAALREERDRAWANYRAMSDSEFALRADLAALRTEVERKDKLLARCRAWFMPGDRAEPLIASLDAELRRHAGKEEKP